MVDHPTACIDHVPNSPYGGIDLPPDEFYQVHTLSSRYPPSPRPGNPSRPSFYLQDPMNGILLSWTIPTHLVMGSLLGPMTLMRDLPLILTLMSLGITPKGNTNSQYFG